MVDRITGGKGPQTLSLNRLGAGKKRSQSTGSKASADSVDFSTVLHGVAQSGQTTETRSPERTARLAALKQQIASGQYQPDLEKVAESMLKFLVEDQS